MGSRKTNQEGSRIKNIKCVHFDRGYCKFGEKCKNKHPDKVCNDKDCTNDNCDFCHPNHCKYGPICKFYQKKVCLYSHVKFPCEENISKIEELEKKILAIEKVNKTSKKESNQDILEKLEDLERKCQRNVDNDLVKQVEKKIDTFEKQMNNMRKELEAKNAQIAGLELRMDDVNKKHLDEKKQKEKKIKELENMLKKQDKEKIQNEVEQFKCTQCDFVTTSNKGLKTHVKRKHTEITSDKYPKTCELCDVEVNDQKELKLHMKTHSYRESNFRCEDCDFVELMNLQWKCTQEDVTLQIMNVVYAILKLKIWKI